MLLSHFNIIVIFFFMIVFFLQIFTTAAYSNMCPHGDSNQVASLRVQQFTATGENS